MANHGRRRTRRGVKSRGQSSVAAAALCAMPWHSADAMDPSCWPPNAGYSHELCCWPYERSGRAECWVEGFSFEQCCMPDAKTTAAHGLSLPASPRVEMLLKRLSGAQAQLNHATGNLQIQWHASWACPPGDLSERPPLECTAHPDVTDALWRPVYVAQSAMEGYAQSAAYDTFVSPLMAAGLRLASALAELRCVLLHWDCANAVWAERYQAALAELCAFMDLVLLELVYLGVSGAGILEGNGGFCDAWKSRPSAADWLSELAQGVMAELMAALEDRGLQRWQLGGVSHLSGQKAAQRGGRAVLVHPMLAEEFAPSCAAMTPAAARFLGDGHNPWVGVTGGLFWHLDISLVMGALELPRNPLLVNLGAEDGGCHQHANTAWWMYDPANCLIERSPAWEQGGWGGVLVEGNATTHRQLRERMAGRRGVFCSHAYIEPESALRTLLEAEPCDSSVARQEDEDRGDESSVKQRLANGDVDLLKIDLDFGDCDFVQALVSRGNMRPRIVHVEVNPFFPPPFAYQQRFSAELLRSHGEPGVFIDRMHTVEWRPWRIGCSLSAFHASLGGSKEYALAQLEFDNALFIRQDLAARLPSASVAGPALRPKDHWLQGFHCDPLRSIIRRDDEYAAFDFRQWASKCVLPDGRDPGHQELQEVAASMRALLARDGAYEVPPKSAVDPGAAAGDFPYSLWIDE